MYVWCMFGGGAGGAQVADVGGTHLVVSELSLGHRHYISIAVCGCVCARVCVCIYGGGRRIGR